MIQLFQDPTDEYLDAMMSEAPGPINFTMFLTLFGERLQVCPFILLLLYPLPHLMGFNFYQGTDPEETIKNAFGCFDQENVGLIHEVHQLQSI